MHTLKYFTNRIGKIVYRNEVSCKCPTCGRGTEYGIKIADRQHAQYLFDVQNELGIKYRDKK